MSLQNQCCKCMALYTHKPDDSAIHCPPCAAAQREAAEAAETYQRRIKAGDINVCPENPADHRTVRRIIKRRLTTEPDTRMSTWRDKKK